MAVELHRLREGQSLAALAHSEAQEAQAEALKQEGWRGVKVLEEFRMTTAQNKGSR